MGSPPLEIKALIVDSSPEAADALAKSLRPDIEFGEIEYTTSTHKALVSLIENSYQICFISDQINMVDLSVFFRDISKVSQEKPCVFVQVRDSVSEDFDRECLRELGLSYVISRRGTHIDRSGVKDALKDAFFKHKLKEKVINVTDSMHMVLAEIDRAAEDLRRGRHSRIKKVAIDFVGGETKFDRKVLDEYFDTLSDKAEQAPPDDEKQLEVPTDVLARELPELRQQTYTGASRRVWHKLKNKYGRKKES